MQQRLFVLILLGIIGNGTPFTDRIKHVIVLMMENRSFDHMMGFMKQNNDKIDGCLPNMGKLCSNPTNPGQSNSIDVFISGDAEYVQPGDPGHSVGATTKQLYNANNNTVRYYPAPMNGFILDYNGPEHQHNGSVIMKSFTPERVPIITTLADEFAMFNSWFCDVPGPTEPNRMYAWAATSHGLGTDNADELAKGFAVDNIFKALDEHLNEDLLHDIRRNDSSIWRVYAEQAPTPIFIEYTRFQPNNFRFMVDIWKHIETGDMPVYTWIDPGYFTGIPESPPSSQHPDYDVTYGEELMKRLYEALRVSPIWNDSLLIITYDEHGGFFDHVSPPFGPSPDGINTRDLGSNVFDFTRIGLRIPTVMISPWINKNTIVNSPNNNEYYNASQYTASSMVHTIREQYTNQTKPITKRDEWSLTFEDIVLNRDEPRIDCPIKLPDVPKNHRKTKEYSSKYSFDDIIPNNFEYTMAKSLSNLCNDNSYQNNDIYYDRNKLGNWCYQCTKKWINKS